MLVVVERALHELVGALLDLGRVGDADAADVHAAVDDALVDALGRRQHCTRVFAAPSAQYAASAVTEVERRHRLGKMHGVVEPEALVVSVANCM